MSEPVYDATGGNADAPSMAPREQAPYSVRIPAAITRAEALTERSDFRVSSITLEVFITATEVALAKALWENYKSLNELRGQGEEELLPPSLIAFTEKVESL